jgi:hypothetical protein
MGLQFGDGLAFMNGVVESVGLGEFEGAEVTGHFEVDFQDILELGEFAGVEVLEGGVAAVVGTGSGEVEGFELAVEIVDLASAGADEC